MNNSEHATHPDAPSDRTDPVEGRNDGELWKRQLPTGEAPARSGGDEDVNGAQLPANTAAYKEELDHRPAPGILDANANATDAEENAIKEQVVPGPPEEKSRT